MLSKTKYYAFNYENTHAMGSARSIPTLEYRALVNEMLAYGRRREVLKQAPDF